MDDGGQVNINAPPADAYGLAMAANTTAIVVATEMRLHREECNKRDERNEKIYTEIKNSIGSMDTKLDTKYTEQQKELNKINVRVAIIVAGISVLVEVLRYVVELIPRIHVGA